jgi:5-methylcytosine-specific restriction endonuclease McrA
MQRYSTGVWQGVVQLRPSQRNITGSAMMIDCDKNMVVHLLRNWRPNRLRPQGFRLANERPRLITIQNGICPLCPELVNDGKATQIDHVVTVIAFADKILQGELTFDEAYRRLWEDSNLRAVHSRCNYDRNVGQ